MKRKKLSDIDSYLYCSIVGTCFSTVEAERICSKLVGRKLIGYSDYDIHSMFIKNLKSAVTFSNSITKKLDGKYRKELYISNQHKTESEILNYWRDGVKTGNIPGCYWVSMSHPSATMELKKIIFGELHMLTHVVNSNEIASRKVITSQKEEIHSLKEDLRIEKEKNLELQLANENISREKNRINEELRVAQTLAKSTDPDKILQLPDKNQRKLTSLINRNSYLENKVEQLKEELIAESEYITLLAKLQNETEVPQCSDDCPCPCSEAEQNLESRTVLFVGGRPAMVPRCRDIVQGMNGNFQYHDGGKEQSTFTLRNMALNADIVICALDCVSHDATRCVKKICGETDQKIIMLKNSGLTNFTKELSRVV